MTNEEQQAAADFASELRGDVIAIELHTTNLGRSRTMSTRHKGEVADHFEADRRAVGSSKKLYAPQQREIKAINSVLNEARAAWLRRTIAYRKGARLLRKDQLDQWVAEFGQLQAELNQALAEADAHREEILDASRDFLGGELFDINDYPLSFDGAVSLSWSVYNFEPSDELLQLAPETYQREQQRVRKQFEAAIELYETEAREQLAKLVEALLSKLNAAANGEKVKYTEAATNNLREFFDRFDSLGIRSDDQLNSLVTEAREVLGGTTMASLKRNTYRRKELAGRFEEVSSKLGDLITKAPARSIDLDELDG